MAELKDLIVNGQSNLIGDTYYKTHAAGTSDDRLASTKFVTTAINNALATAVPSNVVTSFKLTGDTWITTTPTAASNGAIAATVSHKSATAYSEKGSATKVPKISTDGAGHVTAISEVDINFPSVPVTDVKVDGATVVTNKVASITIPTLSVTTSGTGNVVTNISASNHTVTQYKGNVVSDVKVNGSTVVSNNVASITVPSIESLKSL